MAQGDDHFLMCDLKSTGLMIELIRVPGKRLTTQEIYA
jgi:hypothetical protein